MVDTAPSLTRIILIACVALAILLPAPVIRGQKGPSNEPRTLRTETTNRAPNRNIAVESRDQPSPQAPTQNIQQQTRDQSNDPTKGVNSSHVEADEPFSQLTLFLFGSGVAFFIALLAWSDQIRGINQDIREMERRFLDGTGIEKRTFLRIVKPKSPDDKGLALLELASTGRIKNRDSAEVLQIFSKWNKQWSAIERLSTWKYYMTIALTVALFLTGAVTLLIDPSRPCKILLMQVRGWMLLLTPLAAIVAAILTIIICIAKRENVLRALLNSVSDMV